MRYLPIFFIFVLLLKIGIACTGPDKVQMVEIAKKYLNEQKIREAALELKNALKKNPNDAEARFLLGQINLDYGDFEGAIKEFRRARKAGWGEEETQIGLARALIRAQNFQNLLDSIEIKKNYSKATQANLFGLRAHAQAGLGNLDLTKQTLDHGKLIDPNALEILKSEINLQLSNNELETSRRFLNQALSIYPDNPELLLKSATVAIKNNDVPVAMEAYKKIIEQDPPHLFSFYGRQARLGLASLEIVLNQLDQAKSTLHLLLKLTRNDPEVNFMSGWLAFAKGEYERAEEQLLKSLKVAPEHAQTHNLYGIVKFAQENFEQAAYYIGKYVNEVPEDMGARKLLGRTYIILGQQDEAQMTLQTGLRTNVEDAELLALIGVSQIQGGNYEIGINGLKDAIKMDPEQPDLQRELALAYISSGETQSAIKQLNTLLEKGDEDLHTKTLMIIAYLRDGKFNQAINFIVNLAHSHPKDPAVLTLAGNVYLSNNSEAEAEKYFRKALQAKSGFLPAIMSLSQLKESQGQFGDAEILLKHFIKENNKSVDALIELARLANIQGKKEDVLKWLEQAHNQVPNDINPLLMIAEHFFDTKEYVKAKHNLQKASQINPKHPDLLILKSRIATSKNQYQDAMDLLKQVIAHDPNSSPARVLLSEVHLNLNQSHEARHQLETLLNQQPKYIPALLLAARMEFIDKNYDKTLDYSNIILRMNSKLPMAYILAGDAWASKGEYYKASNSYSHAWKLHPSSQLTIKLFETLIRSNKVSKATEFLLAWLKKHPNDTKSLQNLGATYQDQGLNNKAIQIYEKLLKLEATNIVALNNLAWLYLLSNNPEALSLAEQAYKLNPENAGIQDTYGWILTQKGQHEKGLRLIEQAMKQLSEIKEVRYHHAVALLKSGKVNEGSTRLKKLLLSEETFDGKGEIKYLLERHNL